MPAIAITLDDDLQLTADLLETETANAVFDALPIEATINVWGDEHYFEIPVEAEQEAMARDIVQLGELAFWPPGNAFCIFFGRTPASKGADEIRAASPVNVIGSLRAVPVGDLRAVPSGAKIRIEALEG